MKTEMVMLEDFFKLVDLTLNDPNSIPSKMNATITNKFLVKRCLQIANSKLNFVPKYFCCLLSKCI